MKKLISILLSICVLATMFVTLVVPTFAEPITEPGDFKADYFPTGKLETPSAPYIKQTQFEGQDTQLAMYYYQTADLQKLAMDIQKLGDEFHERYVIDRLDTFVQVDVKFNDGEWLSTKGNWNTLNEDHEINYGENIDPMNLTFLNVGSKSSDDADKLLNFTQSWLTYFEADNAVNDYFKPFVKSVNNNGENEYVFDFTETTITYRIRWCVKYLAFEYTRNEEWGFLTSDWSPEVSIGKNGTQQEIKMPDKLEAPVLSEFKLSANEDGTGNISYFASLPDSIYEAERYRLIVDNGFEPYILEAQVKVNDGDWKDCYIANPTWMNNGYRSVDGSELDLKASDDAWIRVRVCSTQDENEKSPWSNIIGTKAVEGEDIPKSVDGKTAGEPSGKADSEKAKCKLCGICPVQPLNICLFIWIAVAVLIILVVVIIIVSKNKKKKNG